MSETPPGAKKMWAATLLNFSGESKDEDQLLFQKKQHIEFCIPTLGPQEHGGAFTKGRPISVPPWYYTYATSRTEPKNVDRYTFEASRLFKNILHGNIATYYSGRGTAANAAPHPKYDAAMY